MRRPHCFFAIRRGKPSPYLCLGIWSGVRAKGILRFDCGAHCFCDSPFAFYVQVNSSHRPAPEAKKFASLSKAAGFLRAIEGYDFNLVLWSPSQGRNSASRKEKFAHIKKNKSANSKHGASKSRCIAQSRKSKKPHAEKGTVDPLFYTTNQTIKEHLSCMRRIDRKQPTVREAMHRSTADRRRKVT